MKDLKHKKILENILGFIPDYTLYQDESLRESYSGLAAEGEYTMQTDYQKLTTLYNDKYGTVIRVFDNSKTEKFDLFMIGEKEKDSRFNILYPENSFKIYLFNENGELQIPKTDGVNPISDNISITEPKYVFSVKKGQLKEGLTTINNGGSGIKLIIEKIDSFINLEIKPGQEMSISKIIVATTINKELMYWIFPLRLNRTGFELPENLGGNLYFCFY